MSAKANRKRARRARQRQDLLSLRAELILLYDGAPVPNHYLEENRMRTREMVRYKRQNSYVPPWLRPLTPTGNVIQDQLNAAGQAMQRDLDEKLMEDMLRTIMTGSSLDT